MQYHTALYGVHDSSYMALNPLFVVMLTCGVVLSRRNSNSHSFEVYLTERHLSSDKGCSNWEEAGAARVFESLLL